MNPPNVAGWPGHEAWIDSSTLLMRMSFLSYVLIVPLMNEFPAIFKKELKNSRKGRERKVFQAIKELNADYHHIYSDLKSLNTERQIEKLQEQLLAVKAPEQSGSLKIDHTNGWNKKIDVGVLLMHTMGFARIPVILKKNHEFIKKKFSTTKRTCIYQFAGTKLFKGGTRVDFHGFK